jgi:hypothetical protein
MISTPIYLEEITSGWASASWGVGDDWVEERRRKSRTASLSLSVLRRRTLLLGLEFMKYQ